MADNLSKSRLDSWKVIADYLGRDVRTVIRWEKDKGLPVHRVPGGKRHAVFAYREEIDAWLASGSGTNNHVPAEALRRMPWGWSLAVAAVLLLLAGVVGLRSFRRPPPAQVESVIFRGSELVALDLGGQEVWTYRFEEPLPGEFPESSPMHPSQLTRVADLDGDGRNEVLTVSLTRTGPRPSDPSSSELICLSPEGKVLWKYLPDATFTFGGAEYKGPWSVFDVLVVEGSRQASIWTTASHGFSFPGLVARIDPATGRGEIQFVNSGTVYSLAHVDDDRHPLLLVGGFNSQYEVGTLAVLDANQPFAASPQEPGRYFCQSCPEGAPLRFFLFPRSELNRLTQRALNQVSSIQVREDGIKVSAAELSLDAAAHYEFPLDLDPARMQVFFASPYWMEHEVFEKKGLLDHSSQECPDRSPLRVLVWSPEAGWAEKRPLQWAPGSGLPEAAQESRKAPLKSSD